MGGSAIGVDPRARHDSAALDCDPNGQGAPGLPRSDNKCVFYGGGREDRASGGWGRCSGDRRENGQMPEIESLFAAAQRCARIVVLSIICNASSSPPAIGQPCNTHPIRQTHISGGIPDAERLRRVAPWCAGTGDPEHAVQHPPMVGRRAPATPIRRPSSNRGLKPDRRWHRSSSGLSVWKLPPVIDGLHA